MPITTVLPKNGFGILFPKEEGAKCIGVLFNSELFPDTAPTDRKLLTVCLDGNEVRDFSEEQLLELIEAELQKYLQIRDRPTVLSVHHWKEAIPQYQSDFYRYQETLDELQAQHPGLFFIGVDRGESVFRTELNGLKLYSGAMFENKIPTKISGDSAENDKRG